MLLWSRYQATRAHVRLNAAGRWCNFKLQLEVVDRCFRILKFTARDTPYGRLSLYLSAYTCQHVDLPASKSGTCAPVRYHIGASTLKETRAEAQKIWSHRWRREREALFDRNPLSWKMMLEHTVRRGAAPVVECRRNNMIPNTRFSHVDRKTDFWSSGNGRE